MLSRTIKTTTLALLVAAAVQAPVASSWARSAPESFADLAEHVSPAVVNISVVQTARPELMRQPDQELPENFPGREFFERFFDREAPQQMPGTPRPGQRPSGVGSGFIIDPQGYVVTNNHVVDGAGEITVTLADGDSFRANLIGTDAKTDLALLKVDAEAPLPAVSFGDSDEVRPGDWVMAVGNPFGLGGSVTAGIVSARGRDINAGPYDDFIQTDAAINRGNSGGPMFDLNGAVIGVNTAIYSPNGGSVGIGFAIPSNSAKQVVEQLRDKGFVERSWLGVRVQMVSDSMAEGFGLKDARGALIASVMPGSPAARAGLKAGDVILSWDGEEIDDMRDLPRLVAATPVGEAVDIELWRNRGETDMTVTTAALDEEPQQQASIVAEGGLPSNAVALGETGLTVADLTDEARQRLGLDADVEGVVIEHVEPGSPAERQGLQVGDVIQSIDMEAIASTGDASKAVERLREAGDRVATVLAWRSGNASFFALPLSVA